LQAANAGDRAAADAALKKLDIKTLYEDAYFGLASYVYASKWGDVSQQIDGLRRATTPGDSSSHYYLSSAELTSALFVLIKLEVKAKEYAEATDDWQRLQKIDKATAAQLDPVFDQLEKIRTDHTAYEVNGLITEGQWFLHMFKQHFRADVSEGFISQVKLRCDKRYVFFAFDPKLQYQIDNKTGKCGIELDGSPGTRFKLIQF